MTNSNFIESAESRETSREIMKAILEVAGGDESIAEWIWENGPTSSELVAIWGIVTVKGVRDEREFFWGAAGNDWNKIFGEN